MIFANVYVGTSANDGTGIPLRDAFETINQNFANILSSESTGAVSSVAGRTGNVTLTTNDVIGAASIAYVNAQVLASNLYVDSAITSSATNISNAVYANVSTSLALSIASTATDLVYGGGLLSPINTSINSINANVLAANTHVQLIDANLGSLRTTVNTLVSNTYAVASNINSLIADVTTLTANTVAQQGLIASSAINIIGANAAIAVLQANAGVQADSITALTANAAAQDTAIASLRSNITAANSAITTANSAVVSYVNTLNNAMVSNITAANAVIVTTNSKITAVNLAIVTINANLSNVASSFANVTANAGAQANQIAGANAAIITANTAMKAYVDALNLAVVNENIGQQSSIDGLRANIVSATNSIVSANLQMQSYVDAIKTSLIANAGAQANQITGANAAIITANTLMKSYVDANATVQAASIAGANAVIVSHTASIASLQSNINAANTVIAGHTVSIANLNYSVNQLFAASSDYSNFAGIGQVSAANVAIAQNRANIVLVNANVTAANAHIQILDANLGQVTTSITSLQANAVTQQNDITSLRSNITAANTSVTSLTGYVNSLNTAMASNVIAANARIDSLALWSNVASVQSTVKVWIQSNLTLSNVRTDAAVASANASIYNAFGPILNNIAVINQIDSRVSSLTTTQLTLGNIVANLVLTQYTDADTASLLPRYLGNINSGNSITGTAYSNIVRSNSVVSGTFLYPNGVSLVSSISNDNTYANTKVEAYLPLSNYLANVIVAANVATFNNVIAYVSNTSPTFSNITIPNTANIGNIKVTTGIFWANGVAWSSDGYGNANVATYLPTYLPTYNGNISGNISFANGNLNLGGIQSGLDQTGTILNVKGIVGLTTSSGATISGFNTVSAANFTFANGVSILSTATGTYSNSNVASYLPTYSGNITTGNVTMATNASIISFPGVGASIYSDSTSRIGSIVLQPSASGTFPGVVIGGSGRIIAPNGSVHMILNASDVTLQVAQKITVGTAATSTTTGALQVTGGIGATGGVFVGGNLSVDGGQVTAYDSIIDLHTYGNLAAWASDDGKDIGMRMHYYNGADKLAFLGLENSTKSLQFLIDATETSGNVTGTFGNLQLGSLFVSNTTTSTGSTATTSGALYVAGGAGIGGNLNVGGNIFQQGQYYETYSNVSNVGGNLTCAMNNGGIFYVTLGANVTANFTNVNAVASTVTGATIIVDQGATAYRVANVQVNGVNQTVKWVGATTGAGTASNTDVMSFSLINLGSGNYRVLGQISNYA